MAEQTYADPLLELANMLAVGGRPPPTWVARHAPSGDLSAVARRCGRASVLLELAPSIDTDEIVLAMTRALRVG